MNRRYWFRTALAVLVVLIASVSAVGQTTAPSTTGDVLGSHDLSAGTSPMHGGNANACIYCHVPHNGLSDVPLWNQKLSTSQYTLYSEPKTPQSVNTASLLCLSCHDGTVAVGQSVAFGKMDIQGKMTDNFGTSLESSHPFSLQPAIKDAVTLLPSLYATHLTGDPGVKLVNNNVECGTCHDVHNQYRDRNMPEFLVRQNAGSALCLSCHTTQPRNLDGRDNPLELWSASVHATSGNEVSLAAKIAGTYTKMQDIGCSVCHVSHNALTTGLLRKNPNRPTGADDTSQACLICHNGSDNLSTKILDIQSEIQKPGQFSHPFADSNNQHAMNEAVVQDKSRHSTCADCHQSHVAGPTASFTATADIRPSQRGVSGIRSDGTVKPIATLQYENCLRCHGPATDRQPIGNFGYMPARKLFTGDQNNVMLQFSSGAVSSHAVMRDETNVARPDLLSDVWDVYFKAPVRPVSGTVLCTDCHNSSDSREFGGKSPNGVHGSQFEHILERQYIMSKASAGPGSLISNLQTPPNLDYTPAASYALCAKCHRMEYINSTASWAEHNRHIQDGFSCSVCHSAHGVPNGTTGVPGKGLVSFDLNVVAPNNGVISWDGAVGCTLTCHEHPHSPR